MSFFTAELSSQKRSYEFACDIFANDPTPETQDVGVVVLDRLMCRVRVMGEGSANASHLVGGDRCTRTRSAHHDASFDLSIAHCVADCCSKVGIVDRRFRICSEVHDGNAILLEKLDHKLLE